MSVLRNLIIAGSAAAFISAPVFASDRLAKLETTPVTAQESCTGWGVHCEVEITPEFCVADDKCAVALPAAALVRYDQRMDAAAGH